MKESRSRLPLLIKFPAREMFLLRNFFGLSSLVAGTHSKDVDEEPVEPVVVGQPQGVQALLEVTVQEAVGSEGKKVSVINSMKFQIQSS